MITNPTAGRFVRTTPYGGNTNSHLGIIKQVYQNSCEVELKKLNANEPLGTYLYPNQNLEDVTGVEAKAIGDWLIASANHTEKAMAGIRAQILEAERRLA